VVSPGEYAVRGGLIDLFPMGSLVPFRVDLFDDEIDSIRTFDPDSQRSLYPVPEVRLLPGREFPMDDEARAKFRSRWREMLEGDPTKSRIYKDMGAGVATAGIEYYLPLFFDDTATVFDYLGRRSHGGAAWRPGTGLPALLAGHERPLSPGAGRPGAPGPAARIAVPVADQFYTRANEHAQLSLRPGVQDVDDNPHFQKLGDLSVVRGAEDPLARLHAHIRNTQHRVLLLAESDGRRESLLDFLARQRGEPARVRFAGRVPGRQPTKRWASPPPP
jgi:transcription-repair coupling factor (superfamily II helicase)